MFYGYSFSLLRLTFRDFNRIKIFTLPPVNLSPFFQNKIDGQNLPIRKQNGIKRMGLFCEKIHAETFKNQYTVKINHLS